MSQPAEPAAGVIHDRGYRHYEGARLGRAHAVRTLFTFSLRAAFGLGRPARAKIMPVLLFVLACLPAVVSAGLAAAMGQPLISYRAYPYNLQLVIAVFLAAQAPELVSRDLRHRTLALYFSRPLRRTDYALAKLAALAAAMLIVVGVPVLILYLGNVFNADGATAVLNETGDLLAGLGTAVIYAVVLAALGLAAAAFTKRRAYGVAAIIALYLFSSAVVNAVRGIAGGASDVPVLGVLTPFDLLDGFQAWLFGGSMVVGWDPVGAAGAAYPLVTVVVLAVAVAVLLRRYRRVQA